MNSHDGTSAYQMFAGMLRFVCTNSMIAGERFEEVRVPHKGNIEHDIIEGVYTVAEDFPRLIDVSEAMKAMSSGFDAEYHPNPQNAAVYDDLYRKYVDLGELVEEQDN